MTFGYPISALVLELRGQRLGLTAVQRGLELSECLLVDIFYNLFHNYMHILKNIHLEP